MRVCVDCCHVKRSARRLARAIRNVDLQPQNAQPASYLEWLEHHTPDHPHAAPLVAQLASPDSAYRSPSARENLSNQAVVAEVWNSVLKLKHADFNTDFFAAGGGYPAAVRLVVPVILDSPCGIRHPGLDPGSARRIWDLLLGHRI